MYLRFAALSVAAVMPMVVVAQTPAGPVAPAAPPAAAGAPANPFPATNPKFFTAASPTVETVNAFLTQLWGFDANRIWSVAAILSTNAPGVSKVVIYVADKTQPGKSQ